MALVNENYLKLRGAYLFPEVGRRVREFAQQNPALAERIIPCGIGDVTEPLPEAVREAMHRAIDEMGVRETFRGYGDPTGYPFLREAIAEGDFRRHGLVVDVDEIFISDGSKTDCGAVLDIFADRGENRIGVPDPVYPVYVDTNVMVGNTGEAWDDGSYDGLIYLPCTAENGFVPEIPHEKLDLVYLCFPNNPTGSMISRDELRLWVEYALQKQAIILYDVAYQAFIQEADRPRSIYEIDGARQCAIEFHSFSKNAGFTGLRCGYTVVPRTLEGRTRTGRIIDLHSLWTRRWSTKSNSVGYPVQRGAEAVYSESGQRQVAELVDYYLKNAAILRTGCEAQGWTVFGGVNAPYVWVQCPEGLSSWAMFDHMLEQAQVVVTPGAGFGRHGEGYFRISAFNTRERVERVVDRIRDIRDLSLQVS